MCEHVQLCEGIWYTSLLFVHSVNWARISGMPLISSPKVIVSIVSLFWNEQGHRKVTGDPDGVKSLEYKLKRIRSRGGSASLSVRETVTVVAASELRALVSVCVLTL